MIKKGHNLDVDIESLYESYFNPHIEKVVLHTRSILTEYDEEEYRKEVVQFTELTIRVSDLVDLYKEHETAIRRFYTAKYIKVIGNKNEEESERKTDVSSDRGKD